jgi:tetratricopeptide (TPR) repeat protein
MPNSKKNSDSTIEIETGQIEATSRVKPNWPKEDRPSALALWKLPGRYWSLEKALPKIKDYVNHLEAETNARRIFSKGTALEKYDRLAEVIEGNRATIDTVPELRRDCNELIRTAKEDDDPSAPSKVLEYANHLLKKGKQGQSEFLYKALQSGVETPEIKLGAALGLAAIKVESAFGAQKPLETLVVEDPVGAIEYDSELLESMLKRAREKDAENPYVAFLSAREIFETQPTEKGNMRKLNEASVYLSRALRSEPTLVAAALSLAESYAERGKVSHAGIIFGRVVRVDPTVTQAWRGLATVSDKKERSGVEYIAATLENLQKGKPVKRHIAVLSKAAYQSKDPRVKLQLYQIANHIDPKDHKTVFNVALSYQRLGETEPAAVCYRNLLSAGTTEELKKKAEVGLQKLKNLVKN